MRAPWLTIRIAPREARVSDSQSVASEPKGCAGCDAAAMLLVHSGRREVGDA
jgi:hypothetical protein